MKKSDIFMTVLFGIGFVTVSSSMLFVEQHLNVAATLMFIGMVLIAPSTIGAVAECRNQTCETYEQQPIESEQMRNINRIYYEAVQEIDDIGKDKCTK